MTRMRSHLGMLIVIAVAGAEARGDFVYDDFSDVSGLMLNGSASQVGDVLRLTAASPDEGGSAFTLAAENLGDRNAFSTHFRFRITDSGGIADGDGAGADGLVFVIQTDSNAVGGEGAGIGYAGISPSVGIEFDTYDNMGLFTDNDPDGNHVGINVNGSVSSIALASEPTRFNNGEIWNAWVDYDGATNELEVRWSLSSLRPPDSQLSATLDLVEILGQDTAFLGFTSGTAAAWGNHDLLGWEYRDRFSPIGVIPEPGTFAMVAGGLVIAGVLGHAQKARRRPRPSPDGG